MTSAPAAFAQTPRDSALRAELINRRDRDQALRDTLVRMSYQAGRAPDTSLLARMREADHRNTAWLKATIERTGWPGRSSVGDDGASAAFILLQHSTDDHAFMESSLSLLEKAVSVGEARPDDYALVFDRVAIGSGLPQRFGTQAKLVSGRVVFEAIEDSAHVDERRGRLGLPPLAVYKQLLDSIYTARPKP